MVITLLTDLNSHIEVVEEQKKIWLYELLYFIGIDIEELEEMPSDLAVEFLVKNHISIIDYPGIGALKVESRKESQSPFEIIGEWAGPEYTMKRDDDTGDLYYEISIECWSIIDEGIDME